MAELSLTCCTEDDRVTQIRIKESSTFEDVKNILAVEFGASPERLLLSFRGDASIPDTETLSRQGVKDNDMLLVLIKKPLSHRQAPPGHAIPQPQTSHLPPPNRSPPGRDIFVLPPELAGIAQLFAPPTQAMIEEQKRKQRLINENMQLAMQESPESFASVYMLYIDVLLNGFPVKAFVDSGAQTTVISRECAERTKVIGLVDPRFAGIAVGVGSARIMGRIHLVPVKIGEQHYNCSFAVLDQAKNLDLLIGLDMLKKYQCNIDLKNDRLEIGTTGQLVPFLPESQLPPHARLHFVKPVYNKDINNEVKKVDNSV